MSRGVCYFSGTEEIICGHLNGRVSVGKNILVGHENSIVSVADCKEQNLLVTVDDGGRMVLWTSNFGYVEFTHTHINLRFTIA